MTGKDGTNYSLRLAIIGSKARHDFNTNKRLPAGKTITFIQDINKDLGNIKQVWFIPNFDKEGRFDPWTGSKTFVEDETENFTVWCPINHTNMSAEKWYGQYKCN